MHTRILYHASSNKNILVIEPRALSIRDPKEGPVVFASHDKAFVTCFLVPWNDSWGRHSTYRSDKHDPIHVLCISDEKRFKELDKGGAIYHLSSKNFYLDETKNQIEWACRENVKPIRKEIFKSGLDAMIENGVIVYFCNMKQLKNLKAEPSNVVRTMEILKSMISENEKRGLDNRIKTYY